MWTISRIRRYLVCLDDRQIFTTRDVLDCGTRAAVDQALSRMVKKGILTRLARGVFAKVVEPETKFTVAEVARAKAESFGKRIFLHAADAAASLGLHRGNNEPTFAVSGRSSAFTFGGIVVKLKECCPRQLWLGDSKAGLVIRSLWYLGRRHCSAFVVASSRQQLGRVERAELRSRGAFMPGWLKKLI